MSLKTDKNSTTGIILHHTTTGFKFLSCRKTGLCRPPGLFTLSEVDRDIQRLSQEELSNLISNKTPPRLKFPASFQKESHHPSADARVHHFGLLLTLPGDHKAWELRNSD